MRVIALGDPTNITLFHVRLGMISRVMARNVAARGHVKVPVRDGLDLRVPGPSALIRSERGQACGVRRAAEPECKRDDRDATKGAAPHVGSLAAVHSPGGTVSASGQFDEPRKGWIPARAFRKAPRWSALRPRPCYEARVFPAEIVSLFVADRPPSYYCLVRHDDQAEILMIGGGAGARPRLALEGWI